ncbi:hypothetical protein [Bacillus cereus]|uniref:hypothetical protein n=1 Tax=Bacillus cereus TaxID=1396 RepID=UPI001E418EA3|nr:hypothetical protein [Bacillus cereus]MCD2337382.1 hypothetical protein [Bacillus cereus]
MKKTIMGFTIVGSITVGTMFGGIADNSVFNSFNPEPLDEVKYPLKVEASSKADTTEVRQSVEGMSFKDMAQSQITPLVSYVEVLAYSEHKDIYGVKDLSDGHLMNLALEGTYTEGDIIAVLWQSDSSEEIAGETLLHMTPSQFDEKYYRG